MSDVQAQALVVEQVQLGLRPDPRLTVSEWSDEHRVLPRAASAEPGPWRTERTPYLRAIMDALSPSSGYEIVVFKAGAQVGKTESGNNWLGYIIHHVPGPALFVQPTLDMAKRTSRQRLAPMIDACPALASRVANPKSRDSGNSILSKSFPGGLLVITGANSAVGLRSMPARYLFLDEVDGYEHDIDGEGDPVELAIKRTSTFARSRKIFICSTPTVKGLSRIDAAFQSGNQQYFHVPCPECGDFAPIVWSRIQWKKDENGKHLPETASLVCEACGCLIEEHCKEQMLANGHWVATAESDGPVVSFHVSALYSPYGWFSWAQAVRDFLKAKRAGVEVMKTWVNTVLGESWEEPGNSVEHSALYKRREDYAIYMGDSPVPNAVVPEPALVITAGADVQKDRIELLVEAWGPGQERWPLEDKVIWGDPEQDEIWEQLDQALFLKTYLHASGVELSINAACIDSGYLTTQVYKYVKPRQATGVFAVKGRDGEGIAIAPGPSQRKAGVSKLPVHLFSVGTHEAKRTIYSRLNSILEPGPGYHHFPDKPEFDEEFFEQLCAEKMVTRYVRGFPKREWVKQRPRNEALDKSVYSLAALVILSPDWAVLQKWMASMAGEQEEDEDAQQSRQPARRRRRSSSRMNSWRKA